MPPDLISYFRNIPVRCDYVFYRIDKGRFVALGDFKKAFNKAKKKAGLPHLRFHDLRGIATKRMAFEMKIPLNVIQLIGGWRTSSMFERYRLVDEKEIINFVNWEKCPHLSTKQGKIG